MCLGQERARAKVPPEVRQRQVAHDLAHAKQFAANAKTSSELEGAKCNVVILFGQAKEKAEELQLAQHARFQDQWAVKEMSLKEHSLSSAPVWASLSAPVQNKRTEASALFQARM